MTPGVWYPADRFQYAPGRSQQPWFEPPAPRGRWVWIPYYDPACPPFVPCDDIPEPMFIGIDPAYENSFSLVYTVTTGVTGSATIG